MSFNQADGVKVPLSVFGGLVTEMTPPGLPEGVSPDCRDVVFVPGSVSSRPGLKKLFAVPFPAGGPLGLVPTVTYGKSFVKPDGSVDNLYLDSNGNLYKEDLAAPGVYVPIAVTTPGSYAKSITAFGREYIAVSDGLHGQEVPLQWDGTNLDRVTQDGPGGAPTVSSIALPSVAMAATGASVVLNLTESDPAGLVGGYFTRINSWTLDPVTTVHPGDLITIAGYGGASAPMNGTWTILEVYPGAPSLLVMAAYLPSTTVFSVAAATGTVTGATTMTRSGNVVTVKTAAAHQLQIGYQAQITGIPAATVGTAITSIVVKNEDSPGVATVKTSSAHGLRPGLFVSITGVTAAVIGTTIAAAVRAGNIVTVTTVAAHGLSPGAIVTLAGVATASFNTTAPVLNVVSATVFTFAQVDVDGSVGAGGTVAINWPIPNSPTPTYFEVLSAPDATTFQVALNYSDGTWTTGTVTYAWNGTFFVSEVLSTTLFQYQQYGPDAITNVVGAVVPHGQAAPGIHQCQVHYLTRQGYVTRPSPPVQFVADGGQFIAVSNLPIGPPNVTARILAFTGSNGAYFFYIPVPAQINGQVVSTATQINDNTTTSVVLDFSDNTLFASLGVSIPGNKLSNQIVLDGALGFGFYGSRLIAWGQRNRVQNLLSMSFDGGVMATSPTRPSGWTVAAGSVAETTTGHFGDAGVFDAQAGSTVTQPACRDAYGAPIIQPDTLYKVRVWLKPQSVSSGAKFEVRLSSASTGFNAVATIDAFAMDLAGSWLEETLNVKTPAAIPSDLILSVTCYNAAGATGVVVDELSLIYAENPYLDGILYGSYVNNPEGFDGLSGKFGPSQDTRKVMDVGIIRETLYMLTQEPGGRLHQTSDNGVTEPAGWRVSQVTANCGLLSAFALTKSQADDASASGGEEWLAWASASGARIFGGDQPYKISQEIQPDWEKLESRSLIFTWALNDPVERMLYFGMPLFGVVSPPFEPVANRIYVMNYRNLDTAYQIATSGPVQILRSGSLSATDHSRKWAPWFVMANGAALMYRIPGELALVLFGGNGVTPGVVVGFGNAYTLDQATLTDDDYGALAPSYMTYFFVSAEEKAKLKLNGYELLAYLTAFVSGVGRIRITPYINTITNAWPVTCTRDLTVAPRFDLEWGGGNAQGERIALKYASLPIAPSTDNSFQLQAMAATLKQARLPIRGSAT